ncbi:DUF4823 domain-containing protein [Photobacterium frigidiphilum]|uniref:DUF4823 domain-containing protein n=1 Tax=Photobacterium frigidiphilum TaxID=264736 RepID=A0A2T3JM55_9GAMM|nr:DUF4823 domain-containing protein [Photobacterium frigidiphilum]PSU50122.1 DUF4823 domain-containing protein [Photobacterium frigidiphilum]
MKKIIMAVCLASLWGCADSHSLNVTESNITATINSTQSVYIALSKDGSYGKHHYDGSGMMLSQTIQSSLIKRLHNVEIARKPELFPEALKSAQRDGYDYLFYPTIMHWEDRSTEWSAKPDKVTVKIAVIDVETQTEIKSAIVDGTSGIATFGGDHPQDLLPEPVEKFTAQLFN